MNEFINIPFCFLFACEKKWYIIMINFDDNSKESKTEQKPGIIYFENLNGFIEYANDPRKNKNN